MASITASPNPVGIYSVNVGAKTTVEWDTQTPQGIPQIDGKVSVLVNGTLQPGTLGNPGPTGRIDNYPVNVPNTYTFILRDTATNAELDRVEVATYDMRGEIIAGFANAYVPDLRPQMITNVVVKPGVDTVRISFKTVHPTIPLTTLMDSAGNKIDARFGLFGGLRTSHTAIFGVETPLELEANHKFRIVASRGAGNSGPKEAVVDGEFISGSRKLDVFFDSVNVHDDGDPGPSGDGEFMFHFGAADAETATLLGEPWPEYGPDDISYEDPPVALNKQISIPRGPRQLWLAVRAMENDSTLWPWDWGTVFRDPSVVFEQPGTRYEGSASWQDAFVTAVFDIGNEPDSWTWAFDMATGDFPVDYVVSGHINGELEVGSVIAPKMAKLRPPLRPVGTIEDAGAVLTLGAGKEAQSFVYGPDGALYHRTVARDSDSRADWNRIELPDRGRVTISVTAPDALDLVYRNADGSLSHRSLNPRRPKDQKWRRLGGNFQYVVPAVETPKGKVPSLLLFGVEDDGSLHVRDPQVRQDWYRLGDQTVSAVTALAINGSGASLFAAGGDGPLLHFSKQKGRWRSQAIAPRPSRSPTLLLTASAFARTPDKGNSGGQDVVIGALDEDHHVRVMRWPDYPRGQPEGKWEDLGPLQELVTGKRGRKAAATKAPAKPASRKRVAA